MIVAQKDEIKIMFKKNLSCLSPLLKKTVEQINEKELWDRIEITYNSEGYPICRYKQENQCFQITSEHPVQEAEQWYKGIISQGTGCIFLYGSGFGYALFELFSKKRPHTLVVMFERDVYLFAAMLHYFDLEPIIKTQKIAFLIGDTEDFAKAFDKVFYSINFVSCSYPTIAFTHAARRNFKASYTKIHEYVFSELTLSIFYLGNCHLDTLIGLNNWLSNAKEILKTPYISCLKDRYKDVPAYIVANGPSLDKNIQQLKNVKDKGLIISTESAIIPLMKNDIKPDILTVIERTPNTYNYHFENNKYPEDITLLCLGLVDKRVLPSFKGLKIPIFRRGETISQWLNKFIGDGSAIDAGANVSHLAFGLAVYLGADPIVFVGQDYAYGSEGSTHSKDSIYYEEKGRKASENIQSRPAVYVESNEGTMIPSNRLWVDFKHGLENIISSHKDKTIINATEGGAKIEGVACEKLQDVIKKYCTHSISPRVNELVAENVDVISLSERKAGLIKLIDEVKRYADIFHNLNKETIKGKLFCREMIRLSQREDSQNFYEIFEEAYQKNINIYQLFIADTLTGCFSQQIVFVFYYLMDRLGVINTSEKITKIFSIQHRFFRSLNIICQSVFVHLEDAVNFLNDTLNELEDSIKEE